MILKTVRLFIKVTICLRLMTSLLACCYYSINFSRRYWLSPKCSFKEVNIINLHAITWIISLLAQLASSFHMILSQILTFKACVTDSNFLSLGVLAHILSCVFIR